MRDIVKAFRRPPAVRLRDRNGGFPRLSDGVAHGYRCPASLRHALLAESLGKPSLWVIINAPWYKTLRTFWLGASRAKFLFATLCLRAFVVILSGSLCLCASVVNLFFPPIGYEMLESEHYLGSKTISEPSRARQTTRTRLQSASYQRSRRIWPRKA